MSEEGTGRPSVPEIIPTVLLGLEEGAANRPFLGEMTDSESRRLRRMTINFVTEELLMIDEVVQSPFTEYRSVSGFVRHAITELLYALYGAGFPSEFVGETVTAMRKMRQHAHRLKLRGEFEESFGTVEESLLDWVETGDWKAIDAQLAQLRGFVEETNKLSTGWGYRLERMVVDSTAVNKATSALYDSWDGEGGEKREKAKQWMAWLESLG
jgi:hypothetical protein